MKLYLCQCVSGSAWIEQVNVRDLLQANGLSSLLSSHSGGTSLLPTKTSTLPRTLFSNKLGTTSSLSSCSSVTTLVPWCDGQIILQVIVTLISSVNALFQSSKVTVYRKIIAIHSYFITKKN